MRRWGFLLRDRAGTTAIEFALIALPLFLLVLGSIQIMLLLFAQQMVETAAEALGRKILTGYVQQQAMTKAQFASLACSMLPTTMNCNNLIVDVQVATAFSSAVTTKPNLSSYTTATATTVLNYTPGTQGQIVVLRLIYALPVVNLPGVTLQSSSYGFNFPMATSVFKNESYS